MLNTAARTALDRIRSSVAYQQRVIYCFHAWMPFNNLGMNGFRFKSIQSPEIPGLELIPITITPDSHIESKIDERSPNLTSVPNIIAFDRSIEDSYADLLSKFGQYGFRRINALDGTLEEMERVTEIFNTVFAGFTSYGRLEDLPAYLSTVSPFRNILVAPVSPRIRTTYLKELDALLKAGKVTAAEYEKFVRALPELAEAALAAHRQALSPGETGILSRSVLWINSGDKKAFDGADNWLIREFPGFDATTKQTVKSSDQDALTRLADMLADRLQTPAPAAQPSSPSADEPTTQDTQPTATEELLQTAFEEEEVDEEVITETESTVAAMVRVQCEAVTKAGSQCKNEEYEAGTGACISPAHQKQVAERRLAAMENNAEEGQGSNGDRADVDKSSVGS